ncbi:hypothetical protein [Serratia fonticola]|uniref:hypothetical protein n=1 Tax=Serratia fonticola TaxID=47917 RepID=UPI0021797055|nr:hypothetical protein [Serratia fonticola]CAI1039252.1 Uncharacterised protein [Serratia fonticola]
MNELSALEILASINKLTSEIKSINPPIEQSFWRQPWIGAVTGVIIGFSLNAVKDRFTSYSLITKKIKCLEFEVAQISEMAKSGLERCFEFYDEQHKNNGERIQVVLPPESVTLCFERFYPDVVARVSDSRRNSLVFTYKHLEHAIGIREKFMKDMSENPLTNRRKGQYINVLANSYAHVYYSAQCFLKDEKMKGFDMLVVVNGIGIKSPYLDMLNKSESQTTG